jgi:isopenicillin-N epimerase
LIPSARDLFLLDPDVVYLNHGAYGATPRPVFERYQWWQRELEREPSAFMRGLPGLFEEVRRALGAYVGADPDSLTLVPNATTGVNLAARTLELRPGDEVLTTDLEYGACDRTWELLCAAADASYIHAPLDELFDRVTERTRVLYASHITSETGLVLPIDEIVERARGLGLTTIVDGAHAPAHVDVDLTALGADFYAGNCHKWLCAPKGSGFLHVGAHWQDRVHGAITSWGSFEPSTFLSRTLFQGTRDPAAYLAIPDAIAFIEEHDDREGCVALARDARRRLNELLDAQPIAPEEQVGRLAAVRLPQPEPELTERLFAEHRIEIPTMGPRRDDLLRVSVAMYTSEEDVERLLDALPHALESRSARSPA